jgi:hypothetical protein
MGSLLLRPELEAAIEWVLVFALAGSVLCIAAVASIYIVDGFRTRGKQK